jgi:hypothetical protein
MTKQNLPNCNTTSTDGEFFSIKQDKYTTEVSDNEKQKKIFYLGLGINILFSIILLIVGFVLLNKNKTEMSTEKKTNEEPLESPWTTGVIICLGIGVLCVLSMIFTGYKTYSLNKPVEKPVFDDITRPCFSTSKNEIVEPIVTPSSSGIKSSITGSNLGKVIADQVLKNQNSVTQSGLDQFDPNNVQITTGASQNTSNTGSGSQLASMDTTGSGSSFKFNQDQTSMNTANAGSTSFGNQGKNTTVGGNSSASSGTSGSSSVQVYT